MLKIWADAQRSAAGAATAGSPPTRKQCWAHGMWNIGRVLATLAATGFTLALWVPWVLFRGYIYVTSPETGDFGQQWYTLFLGPGDIDPIMGQAFASSFSMVLLPLCVLLWQRTWPWLAFSVAHAYGSLFGLMAIVEPVAPLWPRSDDNFLVPVQDG